MTHNSQQRKDMPVFSGVLSYFPDAILYLSEISKAGNDKHNPGQPLHWDRSKSTDEPDAMVRHTIDRAKGIIFDTDGFRHSGRIAWRAMAFLQKELEDANKLPTTKRQIKKSR